VEKLDRDCGLLALGILVWAALVGTAAATEGASVPKCAANPSQPTNPKKIAGFPGDRVYLHPRHPQLCTDASDESCKAHAYVIVGDTMKVSPDCNGWTFVEFDGKKTTTGWVTSARLSDDYSNRGDRARSTFAEAIAPSVYPTCRAVESDFNASLLNPSAARATLKSVLSGKTQLENPPEGVATDAEGNAEVADVTIQGRALKAVTYTVGGTCRDGYLELWDPQFHHRVSLEGSSVDTGQQPFDYADEDLVKVGGQVYFTHSSRSASPTLVAFDNDLNTHALCEIVDAPLKHEALRSAVDRDLCEAVQAGSVTTAPLESVEPYDLEPQALHLDAHGDELVAGTRNGLEIKARARLDVDNDGKPDYVGMLAFGNGVDTAGCGQDVDTAVPIKLDPDGSPSASSAAFNQKMIETAGSGEDTRLVVFRGRIYFETRSHDGSAHDVWELSVSGRKHMCELLPYQYRAVDKPKH
jgi:hypothetical protein